ncbi:apolipoprotein acyltransferase (plasmid) [Escherichia coli]|nr:apolipoprotein acyltransferase [Escherichia coli]MBZ8327409.1 apolipoprotein acyltransferase [Escherichia coli]
MFILYFKMSGKGILGCVIYAAVVTAISALRISIPLNPIILYYKYNLFFLPHTNVPLFNLFIINLFPGLFFSYNFKKIMLLMLFYMVFVSILHLCTYISEKRPKSNVAIIQIGLYYKNGGTSEQFYDDMINFIKNNNVSLVVFSENVYFGYKNSVIKENTDNLLLKIKSNQNLKQYAFLFNFFGYKKINNIISMFLYNDHSRLNQKTALIPFVEKKGIFNSKESLSSEYLNIDNKIKNSNVFDFHDFVFRTYICYDALFPEMTVHNEVVIAQSDYIRLNNGTKYKATLVNGSLLAKFSVAPNTTLINIQNYGGTIVLNKYWKVDWDIYNKSKKEPFLVVKL